MNLIISPLLDIYTTSSIFPHVNQTSIYIHKKERIIFLGSISLNEITRSKSIKTFVTVAVYSFLEGYATFCFYTQCMRVSQHFYY